METNDVEPYPIDPRRKTANPITDNRNQQP